MVVSHSSQRKFGTLQQQLLRLTSKLLQSTTFPDRCFYSERSPGFVGISSNACGSPCLIALRIQHTGTAVLIANLAYLQQQNRFFFFFSGSWDMIIQRIRQRQKETDGDEPYAPFHPLKNPWSKCFFLKHFGTFAYTIFYLWQRSTDILFPRTQTLYPEIIIIKKKVSCTTEAFTCSNMGCSTAYLHRKLVQKNKQTKKTPTTMRLRS